MGVLYDRAGILPGFSLNFQAAYDRNNMLASRCILESSADQYIYVANGIS